MKKGIRSDFQAVYLRKCTIRTERTDNPIRNPVRTRAHTHTYAPGIARLLSLKPVLRVSPGRYSTNFPSSQVIPRTDPDPFYPFSAPEKPNSTPNSTTSIANSPLSPTLNLMTPSKATLKARAQTKAQTKAALLRSWAKPRGLNNPRSHAAPPTTSCLCLRWIQNLPCTKKNKLPTPDWLLTPHPTGWIYDGRPVVLATSQLIPESHDQPLLTTITADIIASLPPHPICPSEPRLALRTHRTNRVLHIEIWNLRNLPQGPYAAETLRVAKIFRSTDQNPFPPTTP